MADKKSRNLSNKTLILIGVVIILSIIVISKILVSAELYSSSGVSLSQEYQDWFGSPPPNIQGTCVIQHVMCYGSGAVTDIPCGDTVCSSDGCPPNSPAYQQSCLGTNSQSGQGNPSNPGPGSSGNSGGASNGNSAAVPIVQNFPWAAWISKMTLAPSYSIPGFSIQDVNNLPIGTLYEDGQWTTLSGDTSGIYIYMQYPDKWPPPNPPNNITNLGVEYSYTPPRVPPLCNTSADCPTVLGGTNCTKGNFSIGVCVTNYPLSVCSDPSGICIITPYQNAVFSMTHANDPQTMLQITTAKQAQCRYSVNADAIFSSGYLFIEDSVLPDSVQHTIPLNNLVTTSGIYSIYEKCIDTFGKQMSKVQTFVITSSGLSARILGVRGLETATFLVWPNATTGAEGLAIPKNLSFMAEEAPPSGDQNLVLVIEKDALPISTVPLESSVSITSPTPTPISTTEVLGFIIIPITLAIVIYAVVRIIKLKKAGLLNPEKPVTGNQKTKTKSSGFKKRI